jgi:hypothetical protein
MLVHRPMNPLCSQTSHRCHPSGFHRTTHPSVRHRPTASRFSPDETRFATASNDYCAHTLTLASIPWSIRAYGAQVAFREESYKRIDRYTRAGWSFYNINRQAGSTHEEGSTILSSRLSPTDELACASTSYSPFTHTSSNSAASLPTLIYRPCSTCTIKPAATKPHIPCPPLSPPSTSFKPDATNWVLFSLRFRKACHQCTS